MNYMTVTLWGLIRADCQVKAVFVRDVMTDRRRRCQYVNFLSSAESSSELGRAYLTPDITHPLTKRTITRWKSDLAVEALWVSKRRS